MLPDGRRSAPPAAASVRRMKTKCIAAACASLTCSTAVCSKRISRMPATKRMPIAHALFGTDPLDPIKMYDEYAEAAERIRPFVTDTAALLNDAIRQGQSVMFEGAQGTMLDIDHGTYPFVTSSSATAGGAVTGTGVGPTAIGTVIGVTKAYVTRVGEGPFPTEIWGETSDLLRARGQEYGAVTGRPRRCGWLDLPLLRYSNQINGTEWLVVTKLDVLDASLRSRSAPAIASTAGLSDTIPADVSGFERLSRFTPN